MALVVLIGFGMLFMFVFDEGMQGADQSLESIIARQEVDIDSLKVGISRGTKELVKAVSLDATAQQLARVKRENQLRKDRIEKLIQDIEATEDAITASTRKFATYKDDYRAFVRDNAKDRTMEQLKTLKGRIYDKVIIREVTEFGVDIRHEGGSARIPPAELPAALQDEFQLDPKYHAKEEQDNHEAGEEAAKDPRLEKKRKKDEAAAREQRIRDIAMKEARIEKLKGEIRDLEQAIIKEKFKRLSKTPQMRVRLAANKSEVDRLQNEVSRLREKL
jgi:hypothetical protein